MVLAPVLIRALEDLFSFDLLPLSLVCTSILFTLSLLSVLTALFDQTRYLMANWASLALWQLAHLLAGLSLSFIIQKDILLLAGPVGGGFFAVLVVDLVWPVVHFAGAGSRAVSRAMAGLLAVFLPVTVAVFASHVPISGALLVPLWLMWILINFINFPSSTTSPEKKTN